MPEAPSDLALILGGLGNLGGAALQIAGQTSLNNQTYSNQWGMYGQQRRDALADRDFNNQYNHPSSVMARLREAGLNPNLVYGHGAATTEASPVRAAQAPAWNPQTPNYSGIGTAAINSLTAFMDTRVKEAQVDNLRTQNTVLEQEALSKKANTYKTLIDAATGKFKLELEQDLRDVSAEMRSEELRKLQQGNDIMLTQEGRAAALHAPNMAAALENVKNLAAQRAKTYAEVAAINQNVENAKKDGTLKDFEIQLNKLGLTKSDPRWMRIASEGLSNIINGKKPDPKLYDGSLLENNSFDYWLREKMTGMFK